MVIQLANASFASTAKFSAKNQVRNELNIIVLVVVELILNRNSVFLETGGSCNKFAKRI